MDLSQVLIRNAQIEDAAGIQNIYRYYVDHTSVTFDLDTPSLDVIGERIDTFQPQYGFFVAELNEQIIGYAYASPYSERRGYQRTASLSIYVDHEYQDHHVGKRLLEALIDELEIHEMANLLSVVNSSNETSLHFHERNGFERYGHLDRAGYKLGQWQAIDLLVRRLSEE